MNYCNAAYKVIYFHGFKTSGNIGKLTMRWKNTILYPLPTSIPVPVLDKVTWNHWGLSFIVCISVIKMICLW